MESSKQQAAREIIRPLVLKFTEKEIHNLISIAQNLDSANKITAAIWPKMDRDSLIKLATADANYLNCSTGIPNCLLDVAEDHFLANISPEIKTLSETNNSYAQGTKLRKTVREAIDHHSTKIFDFVDQLFEKARKDRLSDRHNIQALVIQRLNNLCIQELCALDRAGEDGDEVEAKRHLKALTALSYLPTDTQTANTILGRLTDGKTSDLPYVLKYLSLDQIPKQKNFASISETRSDCIDDDLINLIPEATPLKSALESYLRDGGIISKFLSPLSEVTPSMKDKFRDLPLYIPSSPSGILLPKHESLEVNRIRRYSLPDGVVCAVGLAVLLESILRQLTSALNSERSSKERPKLLIDRLTRSDDTIFSRGTIDHLEIVFGTSQIALRDAVAHGVFIANDEHSISKIVSGLTHTVRLIMQDIRSSGRSPDFFSTAFWCENQNFHLNTAHEETFRVQFEGSNLINQPEISDLHSHKLNIINKLIPDKAPICRVLGLIWVNMDPRSSAILNNDSVAEFVGVLGALIAIEELFRAAQEVHGQRVMWPEMQSPTSVMCRLSMLDDTSGGLLDPKHLKIIFGDQSTSADFIKSLEAVRALRDLVFHGGWGGLRQPKVYYIHLIQKLILAICTTISLDKFGEAIPSTSPSSHLAEN